MVAHSAPGTYANTNPHDLDNLALVYSLSFFMMSSPVLGTFLCDSAFDHSWFLQPSCDLDIIVSPSLFQA